MEIPKNPPAWANWFHELGAHTATIPFQESSGKAARIVVSVPTGQFTTWMIVAGALSINPQALEAPEVDTPYATWNNATKRMDDCVFAAHKRPNQIEFVDHPGFSVMADKWPVKAIPEGTPENRSGASPRPNLRDELRELPGLKNNWFLWYARQCLSPVVIIGDGREYLQNQREELLEKAPKWFTDEARALLSEDSQQTSNPERMYFHPFMVLHASVGNNHPWLRAMQPRLVIVTSWSSYTRQHQSLFAGAPHLILTNRRVASSIDASTFLSITEKTELETELLDKITPPHGVFLKSFNEQVLLDQGDVAGDDEMDIEI
jgi:hypothetical protein